MDREFSIVLVAISLILIILISVFRFPPGWLFTLYAADIVICGALAWDFILRLRRAPEKTSFLRYHGYEALAAIPVVVFYLIIRFSGLVIILRVLKLLSLLNIIEWNIYLKNQISKFIHKKPFSPNS
jgi:hypothetical protein